MEIELEAEESEDYSWDTEPTVLATLPPPRAVRRASRSRSSRRSLRSRSSSYSSYSYSVVSRGQRTPERRSRSRGGHASSPRRGQEGRPAPAPVPSSQLAKGAGPKGTDAPLTWRRQA